MNSLWKALEKMKQYDWVELSHPLDDQSPHWDGIPDGAIELGRTAVDFDEMNLKIQTFKFPGQFGTHIDYPGHFIKGGALSDSFSVKDTVFPLVVIDVSAKVWDNPDYELTIRDILEHEEKYGRIPEGCFVAMRTDWHKRWPDGEALSNFDEEGNEHFPGWTLETLRFLVEERGIAGNGHETLDADAPISSEKVKDLPCERYILGAGKIQVEVMKNLDKVPPTGAIIVIAVPRIDGATGLPARVWAIVDRGERD